MPTAPKIPPDISIIDTESFAVVNTVETGLGAHGVVIEPSSRHAYVSNIYGDDVAVIDLPEAKVVATIPTGAGPNGISFSPLAPATAPAAEIKLTLPEHDDDPLPGETGTTLTLSNVQAANAGTYHLVATNSQGEASSADATVVVAEPLP